MSDHLPVSAVLDMQAVRKLQPPDFEGLVPRPPFLFFVGARGEPGNEANFEGNRTQVG